MLKRFSIFLAALFLSFFLVGNVFADVTCQPVYGGGQTCVTTGNILVNKTLNNPATGQFVDNLGINDPKFAPGQQIIFNIAVTNTGPTAFSQVTVRDVLPPTVIFTSATSNGVFDQNSRTVTFNLSNLLPNETRTLTIQGVIVDASKLAKDVVCDPNQTTNVVVATTNTGQSSTDQAVFCIQKQITKGGLPVFPPPKVIVTPPTGPEVLPLIGLLPAGIGGWFLRKFKIRK